MLHGNAIIGQSGGPTSVINASLCGIIEGCLAQQAIGKTLGPDKGNSQYLYELFPYGPAKQACKIAGLPKPTGCVAENMCARNLPAAAPPVVQSD